MTVLKNALAVNDGKAVVISIKREWLAKIMSGEKDARSPQISALGNLVSIRCILL